MSEKFFPVRLNTLRDGEEASFDVYVKVGAKYVHYTRENEELEGSRLAGLKSRGVRKLYIKANDEDSYLAYLERGLRKLNNTDVSLQKRASFAHDSLVTSAENAQHALETEAGFNNQRNQMNLITDFLKNNNKALKEMLQSAGISLDTNAHAATVASLAVGVGTRMGLNEEELFELGMAALLHDQGKERLKFDSMKSPDQMTPAELREYKNHPQDGADMLAGKPFISPRILGLIASHEEKGQGRGYPEKKDVSKLALPYRILIIANAFDRFCIQKKIKPVDAIDPFYEAHEKDFEEELITILATVLN